MWQFEPFLPVAAHWGSHLQVGGTPLLNLGSVQGINLWLKDETRNPSGSLKDRASELVLAVAAAGGITEVVMASTGNAAASLAAVGAAQQTRVSVVVPRDIPVAKLAQIRAFGAEVHRIDGSYAAACAVASKLAKARGALNRTTGLNPFTREGKKTCAYEIALQLQWDAPDWVIVPTGDGNILSAMAKGFADLKAAGLIQQHVRLVAVQTAAACPIAQPFDPALRGKASATSSATSSVTCADSINVADPMDLQAAVLALQSTAGQAVVVDDAEISAAVMTMAARFGVFLEPSSAAGYAGFERLRRQGVFAAGDRVVLVGTGTGLKDLTVVIVAAAAQSAPAVHPDDWRSLIAQPALAGP
ncbi:pyridoxal-phosphate dependent enzyme [Pseudophaeobacter leonis]|uniref:pyridoxal-phosphate dependent enzyme n=1 Tax=Pseudophaeobacter leonis TaxID=1144477 RepID=UPI001374811C|nr:pyridoxal-phosphate dependent enzyme [Pseudophaeobacter leonis]